MISLSRPVSGTPVLRLDPPRAYEVDDTVVLGVIDKQVPWNQGTWRLTTSGGRAEVEPTDEEPVLRLDIWDLGTVYLGGFMFGQLLQAGRLSGSDPEAIRRADRMFRTDRPPWCPQIF